MRDSINFNFNGISSEDMGVVAIRFDGLQEQNILPIRSIVETKIPNRDVPYHQRVDLEPLSFPMTIYIEEWRERNNLRQIAKWLFQSYYKPLTFYSNLDKVYYAMFEGDSTLFHNGMKEGYVMLNVRCSSPYAYSHPKSVESIGNSLHAYNDGDMSTMPKLTIKKTVADGTVSIASESGNTFSIANLQVGESVSIDNHSEEIVSSLEYLNVYRYDDHNGNWITLETGDNQFDVDGDCEIEVIFEEKYLY